jgi:hypothetical protein
MLLPHSLRRYPAANLPAKNGEQKYIVKAIVETIGLVGNLNSNMYVIAQKIPKYVPYCIAFW